MCRLAFLIAATWMFSLSVLAVDLTDIDCSDNNCLSSLSNDIINLGEEIVKVESLFIPKGFDENDHVEVMASGFLPNPCYRRPYALIEKAGTSINVTVKAARILDPSRLCIAMAVPYLIAVPVGPVTKGNYSVTVNANTANPQFSQMNISERDPQVASIDDHLYAQVDSIKIDPVTRVVTLQGENPSPCIEQDRIDSTSNGLNTYAILPIVKKNENIECTPDPTPFKYRFQLSNELQAPKILVHVRTMEGSSMNKVFTPKD